MADDLIKDKRETYLWDIDGCIVFHTEIPNPDFKFLPGAIKKIKRQIKNNCYLILLTGRSQKDAMPIINELEKRGIRFQNYIFDLPVGTRTIINDTSAEGECKAFAISHKRNQEWK